MVFTIQLADKVIEIHSIFRDVRILCQDYIVGPQSGKSPDFIVRSRIRDILCERKNKDGNRYSLGYLETLSVYRKIAEIMPLFDTFLMHGSVVAVNGEGYLFTAKSGVGKTTHTQLWLKNIQGSFIVNGDKPFISVNDGKILVSGTPWAGKEGMNRNVTVPLKAIYLLERGEENHISSVSSVEAFPVLLQQTYKNEEKAQMVKTIQLLKSVTSKVNVYRLRCNISDEAVSLAYHSVLKE